MVEVRDDHSIPLGAVPQIERADADVDDGLAQEVDQVRVDDRDDDQNDNCDGFNPLDANVRDVHGEEPQGDECIPARSPYRCLILDFHRRRSTTPDDVTLFFVPHKTC